VGVPVSNIPNDCGKPEVKGKAFQLDIEVDLGRDFAEFGK
jgi:hypothetical protein